MRTVPQAHTHEQRRIVKKQYNALFVTIGRRDGFKCGNCHRPTQDLQIDHILPVSHGGTSELSNLQLLCALCNGKKSNQIIPRLPSYYTQSKGSPVYVRDLHPKEVFERNPGWIWDTFPFRVARMVWMLLLLISILIVVLSLVFTYLFPVHPDLFTFTDAHRIARIAWGVFVFHCIAGVLVNIVRRSILDEYMPLTEQDDSDEIETTP